MKVGRGFPYLGKQDNIVCNECQLGKLTSNRFINRSYISQDILKIVHTNLCGPIGT